MARDDEEYVAFAAAAHPRLRRTAYLMCGDWHLAADLTQEALVRVYVAWPRITRRGGGDSLHAYARRALTSAAIDWGRKRSSGEIARSHEAFDEGAHDPWAGDDDRAALMDALRALPPRQRACVVLRFYEDLSVADVAAALGCSQGTVKSQTSKALDALRRSLSALDLTEASSW